MALPISSDGIARVIQCLTALKYPHQVNGNELTIFDFDDYEEPYTIEAEVSNELNVYMVAEYLAAKAVDAVPCLKDELFSRHKGLFAKYSRVSVLPKNERFLK